MKRIQITYSKFKKRIMAELAFVGKRQQAVKGDPLFSTATFSSAEDAVVESAVMAAANVIVRELKEYVKNYFTIKDDDNPDKVAGVEFLVENDRSDENIEEAVEQAILSFLTSCATASLLSKASPDLAKAYSDEAATALQSAVSLAVHKNSPGTPPYSKDDVKGSVTFEDGEDISET